MDGIDDENSVIYHERDPDSVEEIEDPEVFEKEFDRMSVMKSEWKSDEIRDLKKALEDSSIQYKPTGYEYGTKWLFGNGFGISVIRDWGENDRWMFEIAVLRCIEDCLDGEKELERVTVIEDRTPITDEDMYVINRLTSEAVLKIGKRIADLPDARKNDWGESDGE